MAEVKVKITNGKINFTDKKDGTQKEAPAIVLEFPNGATTKVLSGRYTYRLFDYLNDLLNGK